VFIFKQKPIDFLILNDYTRERLAII